MIHDAFKVIVGLDDTTFLNLGNQPLANQLHKTREDSIFAKRYPLCAIKEKDQTIHLDTAVPPELLYHTYVYNSGISSTYKDHCRKMFYSFRHLKHDTIIDIGGNDGTLLKTFQEEAPEAGGEEMVAEVTRRVMARISESRRREARANAIDEVTNRIMKRILKGK